MKPESIEEMSEQEFDVLLDKIADADFDQLTPSAFLDAVWALKARQSEEVIEVTAEVVGDELRFEPCPALLARGNEIFLAGKRVLVKLKRPVPTLPVK